MDINVFEKYDVNVLGLQNTKSGEPQLKDIGKKYQDKNEFIFHNNLSDSI